MGNGTCPGAYLAGRPVANNLKNRLALELASRSYLINGFMARKPQNRRGGNSWKVMIWLSFKSFAL